MSFVGKKAPHISASAVIDGKKIVDNFNLAQFVGKKNVVLFFYPKDFSSVCPKELYAFQEKLDQFEKKDTVVIGCSTDTEETHLAWLNTPKKNGGIKGVTFPIIADTSKIISLNFGVLGGEYLFDQETKKWSFMGAPIALRGTFMIDKKGIIRHASVNDFLLLRNVDEYIRMVDEQLNLDKHGDVCPADWEEANEPSVEEVVESFSTN